MSPQDDLFGGPPAPPSPPADPPPPAPKKKGIGVSAQQVTPPLRNRPAAPSAALSASRIRIVAI